MIANYIKLALRVLARKKFFTFITLFGISFTLMILMIFASYMETELGDNAPISKKDKMVLVNMLTLKRIHQDTIMTIDTVNLDGMEKYDTTYEYTEAGQSISRSSFSEKFFNTYLHDIDKAEKRTLINAGYNFDVFTNNSKINIKVGYCDHHYWEVFDYHFLDGHPFDQSAFENGEQVVVITQNLAKEYFGSDQGVVGKNITFDGRTFKIIGMVEDPKTSFRMVSADAYTPYTLRRTETDHNPEGGFDYFGGFSAGFLAPTTSAIPAIIDQIKFKESTTPMPVGSEYNIIEFDPMTYSERYAQRIIYEEDASKSKKILWAVIFGILSLFILLPTLNLINLNVSRILERSSEIGVRKAFGANRNNILLQFIFENVVQTILGGILGLGLALIVIKLINDSQILENVKLVINLQFFIACILITLFFGIVSGLLPAYRMSKIHIVNALKSNQL